MNDCGCIASVKKVLNLINIKLLVKRNNNIAAVNDCKIRNNPFIAVFTDERNMGILKTD